MRREKIKGNSVAKGMKTGLVILAAGVLLCGCGSEKDSQGTGQNDTGADIIRVADLQSELSQDGQVKEEVAVGAKREAGTGDNTQGADMQQADLFMIKVKDEIYVDTGKISTLPRCGLMDGEITSKVKEDELPKKNDQSNFGKGYGYQYSANNTIDVNIDGQWHIFKKQIETDIYSITITHGTTGQKLELSGTERAGEFWEIVEQFEALEPEKSENQTPSVGYTYWLKMFDEAGAELHSVTPFGETLELDGVRYSDYEKGTAARLFLAVDALWETNTAMADLAATDRQSVDTLEGISMEVTYATAKGANLTVTNDTNLEINFGESYSLYTYVDGSWYEVGYLVDNWAVNAIAYNVPKGGSRSWSVHWAWLHGEMEPGTYRIVKEVMDFRGTGDFTKYYLGAEFVVE